ncbi:hypothetical protein BD626DRAFT_574003 [Schizophyllum amplum]|uniref:Uncharacterized protein n=1 Tax=Schizophyllum amplum TaxID=97359 RepID=A0A550BZN8_9AGAR|nr:hypothetical protein BD626DRAFT_574003 [Auriculariopsis ampla]
MSRASSEESRLSTRIDEEHDGRAGETGWVHAPVYPSFNAAGPRGQKRARSPSPAPPPVMHHDNTQRRPHPSRGRRTSASAHGTSPTHAMGRRRSWKHDRVSALQGRDWAVAAAGESATNGAEATSTSRPQWRSGDQTRQFPHLTQGQVHSHNAEDVMRGRGKLRELRPAPTSSSRSWDMEAFSFSVRHPKLRHNLGRWIGTSPEARRGNVRLL